jgi:hypothetical protein
VPVVAVKETVGATTVPAAVSVAATALIVVEAMTLPRSNAPVSARRKAPRPAVPEALAITFAALVRSTAPAALLAVKVPPPITRPVGPLIPA